MIRSALPRLIVHDPDAAIAFYEQCLDGRLAERFVLDDVVVHARLHIGDASFTVAAEVKEWGLFSPLSVGGSSSLVTLEVADARAVSARMVSAGAAIVIPIEDRPYGRCEGRVRDPFGHLWIPSHPLDSASLPVVRRIVPDLATDDVEVSAEFYRQVLGLDVVMDLTSVVTLAAPDHRSSQLTLIDRTATEQVDPEVSFEVEELDAVWDRVVASGAEIVRPRRVEPWGVRRFFVRDPAGHVINVLCHRPADE